MQTVQIIDIQNTIHLSFDLIELNEVFRFRVCLLMGERLLHLLFFATFFGFVLIDFGAMCALFHLFLNIKFLLSLAPIIFGILKHQSFLV